jgi:predicted dehydrogenase
MKKDSEPRLALIGCGGIAGGGGDAKAGHLLSLEKMGLHVSTYCDVNLALARKRREQFGPATAQVTDDAQKVFDDPAIDAVIICTRHDSNAPLAVRAAEAGKHVFVEKALALTERACQDVIDAQKRTGRKIMVGFSKRYTPAYKALMPLKGLAKLLVAQCSEPAWDSYDFWGKDPVSGGGQAFMCGIHVADMLLELAGSDPVRIMAMGELHDTDGRSEGQESVKTSGGNPNCADKQAGSNVGLPVGAVEPSQRKPLGHPAARPAPNSPRPTVINKAYALVEFANGVHGIFASGDTGDCSHLSKFSLEFHTGQGVAVAHERLKYLTVSNIPGLDNVREEDEHFDDVMRDFVRCVRDDLPAPVGPVEGLRATRLIVRIIESIRTGGPVKW